MSFAIVFEPSPHMLSAQLYSSFKQKPEQWSTSFGSTSYYNYSLTDSKKKSKKAVVPEGRFPHL